jgi:hypothetical protein
MINKRYTMPFDRLLLKKLKQCNGVYKPVVSQKGLPDVQGTGDSRIPGFPCEGKVALCQTKNVKKRIPFVRDTVDSLLPNVPDTGVLF